MDKNLKDDNDLSKMFKNIQLKNKSKVIYTKKIEKTEIPDHLIDQLFNQLEKTPNNEKKIRTIKNMNRRIKNIYKESLDEIRKSKKGSIIKKKRDEIESNNELENLLLKEFELLDEEKLKKERKRREDMESDLLIESIKSKNQKGGKKSKRKSKKSKKKN